MKSLVYNAIRTPDGTVLESTFDHDYRTYVDKNGCTYMVDGGLSYLRRNITEIPCEELSVYSDDPHEIVREVMKWGTSGKSGTEPFRRVALKDMDSDHIQACLDTQPRMRLAFRAAFEVELKYRGELK